jgi:dienelactone hydrolase
VKRTENIVKELKAKSPESKIYLTGHSLGGSTAHEAMVKSPVVRENVEALHTFNAGTSPLQSKGLAKSNKAYKVVAAKSTHHAVQNDLISQSIRSNLIGKHKIYKAPTQKASVGRTILRLAKPHLEKSPLGRLVHFGAEKILDTLSSHSLDNFTN